VGFRKRRSAGGASVEAGGAGGGVLAGRGEAGALEHEAPTGSHTGQDLHEAVVPSTRTATVWAALAVGLVVLVGVLVFVLENLERVEIRFIGFHWRIPVAVGLLLSAAAGAAVVFLVGAARILQLRRLARRHHDAARQEAARHGSAQATP
jgi:uncharacterized integral membrane protein